ncbi:MAG: hypothetical protein JOZ41_07335, partial [Chloroflexi bacterium]|nr:hypothetical protein [Chloroflexota bacterium]
MDRRMIRGHVLVLVATLAGIVGMGIVFEGATRGSLVGVSRGMPLLLLGLWWAGRELARSMMLSRARRAAGAPPRGRSDSHEDE